MALHFATTEGNMDDMDRRDCVVYRLDIEKLHNTLPKKYKDEIKRSGQKVFTIDMLDHVCEDLKQYDNDMENKTMVIVEPPSMDERMMNQYSFFSIVPAGVDSIESLLDSVNQENRYNQADQSDQSYQNDAIVKFVISKNLRWEIRDMLDMSNINERVVYPGLDGIATWLARHYYVRNKGKIYIQVGNIVELDVDAIVNSADADLVSRGIVSQKIFECAGKAELEKECASIGKCNVGSIAVTGGYKLKAKYIIHAVTPKKTEYDKSEIAEEFLRISYRETLDWVKKNGIKKVGFPLLASGHKGFSSDEAWRIGLEECSLFLEKNENYYIDIFFIVTDQAKYVQGQNLLNAINGDDYRYPELFSDRYDAYERRKRENERYLNSK